MCLQLLINDCRIVGKRRLIFGILSKLRIFLHVKVVTHLVKILTALLHSAHLLKEISEVIAKSLQISFAAYFEMAGNHVRQRELQNMVQRLDPVRGAALVHRRARAVKKQIPCRHYALLGEVDESVPGSVRLAGEVNIYWIGIEVNGHLLLKRNISRAKVKACHFRALHQRQSAMASEIRADHDRVRADHRIPPLMVGMVVGVDDELNWQIRDLPDGT